MKMFASLAGCVVAFSASAAVPSSYTIVDLGADKQPTAVNKYGVVVGYTISSRQPVKYENGAWTPLQSEGTGQPTGINAKGLIVGVDGGKQVEWSNGKRKELAGTGRGGPAGVANDSTIVGSHWGGSYDFCYTWRKGVYHESGGLGGDDCYMRAIDPTGSYRGGVDTDFFGDDRGFINGPSGTVNVGILGGTEGRSEVRALNKLGHAAVWSTFDNTYKYAAAYWDGTRLVDIGLHPPGVDSRATAINDADTVLVQGSDGAGHVLFLYGGRTGITTAVEPLIANPDGWVFDYGTTNMVAALTDKGAIYGTAHFNGELHAFELVPQR